MAKQRRTSNRPASQPEQTNGHPSARRELIVLARPSAELQTASFGRRASRPARNGGLAGLLEKHGATAQPLFGASEERIRARSAESTAAVDTGELAAFYHVSAPQERLEQLAESLRGLDEIEAAYVKPAGAPPVEDRATTAGINDMAPSMEEAPGQTPDFTPRQIYLDAAPAGVDARYAWRFRGGRGADVRITDCEWGWRFTHEDLIQNQGGVVIGTASPDDNHGTAVLGEFSGDLNSFGITGICSDAFVSAASFETLPTATVIQQAADRLRPGDIILLEIHRPGPGASGAGQDGYIAIEWWPDDFAAIRYAVARGVIVVEAAGNGARNLDDPIYNRPAIGFPVTWRNPFNPANPSSGAILVGAGAPPPGTHGQDHGPDRSRLDFSNYGQRIDTQGWGREVTSTGYGDLQGGSSRDLWYTDQFSGTSSASPIIVGVLGCLQGILRAHRRTPLTPAAAQQLLRTTGSPQQDAPDRPRTQRIGNRPDLRQLITRQHGVRPEVTDIEEHMTQPLLNDHQGPVVVNIRSQRVTVHINGSSVAALD